MPHNDKIKDCDAFFEVDPITRQIINKTPAKIVLMQGDHNSEKFTFTLPRYIEGHDMAESAKAKLHYVNPTKPDSGGMYEMTDLQIDESDAERVKCSWLISANVTKEPGAISFLIEFECYEGNVLVYSWHTAPFNGISIGATFDFGAEIATQYADILEQWKQRLFGDLKKVKEDIEELDRVVAEVIEGGGGTGESNITVVQTPGESETDVMSQKAVTDYVTGYIPKAQSRNLAPTIWENAAINANGYWAKTDGIRFASSPEYIPVVGGEPYTFSWQKGFANCTLYIYTYDADKSYIKVFSIAGMSQQVTPATKVFDDNCAYVRICIDTWVADTNWQLLIPEEFQIEKGEVETEYVLPKVIDSKHIDYSPLVEEATKPDYLYGKKLVACGDSITDAWNGEVGSGYYESYAEITAKRHNMIFTKNAVSGSTMAYNADGNSPISTNAFSNTRYLNLPEFDYLTIWFGWNDHAYSEVGTIDDTDNTTFYGAYKIVLEHLITNNPTKKIGLIIPYGIKTTKMEAVAQAVRDISKMYGVPCLDLRDYNECSGFWGTDNDVQLARRAALTYDTTHPNQAGHEYLSTMYENFLKRL